jgi:DNA processing protein
LIKSGAILISNTDEILKSLGLKKLKNMPVADVPKTNHIEVPKQYEEIYKILSVNPIHINQICKTANKDIANISSTLTMLELEGYIEQLPGKMFKIL